MRSFPVYWRHALKVLRQQGLASLLQLVAKKLRRSASNYYPGYFDFGYQNWLAKNETPCDPLSASDSRPVISIIVPVYNVDARWLKATIDSVLAQTYDDWQLYLINDASTASHIEPLLDQYADKDQRIVVKHQKVNSGIAGASNVGLSLAQGEFIALLDHDDLLAVDALLHNVHVINQFADIDLVYSDEDKVDTSGKRNTPFCKPDYSPELLCCQNYIGHLVVARRTLIEQVGGFRAGFDGAQDYDLLLRLSAQARRIEHIPRVLYHWRQIPGSTAMVFNEKDYAWEAGRRALSDFLGEKAGVAEVNKGSMPGTFQPGWLIKGKQQVSVIIPFRDQASLLDRCLTSLFAHTQWTDIEVIGVNNQSIEPETLELMQRWQKIDPRVRFIDYDHGFNYSAICNHAVAEAGGDYIVLMNNDVEITSANWVENLLGYAQQDAVGAVGAMLHYPDGSIQHAGIIIGIGGTAGHPFKHFPQDHKGYFGRLTITSNVSAVTGALLMVEKTKYLEVGGLDESAFSIGLNDVDFCLKLQTAGYRNVVSNTCNGIHHESQSRGYEISDAQRARQEAEQREFAQRWQGVLKRGDRYYNPNLTLASEDYTLR